MSVEDKEAALVDFFQNIFNANRCGSAATTLLLYDYLVTLPREIDGFWEKKCNGASILFFMNRYIPLVSVVVNSTRFGITGSSCVGWVKAGLYIETLEYVPWAGFTALRTYAMSSNRAISCLIFALFFVQIISKAIVDGHFVGGVVLPRTGCIGTSALSTRTSITLTVVSRLSLIIADLLVIYVTWARIYRHGRLLLKQHSLTYIVVRDGTMYFICLLLLNTVHLTLSVLSVSDTTFAGSSNVIQFIEPLTAILVWRFMLDLQEVDRRNAHHDTTLGDPRDEMRNDFESLKFNSRVIGSIGCSGIDSASASDADVHPNQNTVYPEQPRYTPIELQSYSVTSTRAGPIEQSS